MAVGAVELQRQQMQEAAANAERIRKENIEVFTKLFLSLGPDVIRVAGSSYDPQLAEARGLASHRWGRLLDLEAQIQRDAAAVGARPKKRPAGPGDWKLPESAIERMEKEYKDQTEGMRRELATLKEQAKNERRELESWRVDYRKGK